MTTVNSSSPTFFLTPACAYTSELLEEILAERGTTDWKIIRRLPTVDDLSAPWTSKDDISTMTYSKDIPPSFHWSSFSDVVWDCVLTGHVSVSHNYARRGLALKSDFYYYLNKYRMKWNQSNHINSKNISNRSSNISSSSHCESILSSCIPVTIPVDADDTDDVMTVVERVVKEDQKVGTTKQDSFFHLWFVKNSIGNRGEGIRVASSQSSLRRVLEDLFSSYRQQLALATSPSSFSLILQQHIPRPLLVQSRKFHLRCHALTVGSPVSVLLHTSSIVALLASGPYSSEELSDGDGDDWQRIHLTNHCVQANMVNYDESSSMYLLSELQPYLPIPLTAIYSQLVAIIHDIFAAFHQSPPTAFYPLPSCWELLGIDIMLDCNGQCWLLEVNPGNDVAVLGSKYRTEAKTLLRDCFSVTLDRLRQSWLQRQHMANIECDPFETHEFPSLDVHLSSIHQGIASLSPLSPNLSLPSLIHPTSFIPVFLPNPSCVQPHPRDVTLKFCRVMHVLGSLQY